MFLDLLLVSEYSMNMSFLEMDSVAMFPQSLKSCIEGDLL